MTDGHASFNKDDNAMDFSKKNLLTSGFTERELQKLQNNIDSYGGTLEEIVRELSRKFNAFMWIVFFCLSFFLFLVFSKNDDVFSGGIALLIAVLITAFIQPPVMSYKSWRFCMKNKD